MSMWSKVMMVVLSFTLWGCPEPTTDLSELACPDSTRMYRDASGQCVCDEGFSFNSDGTQCVACTPSCAPGAECGSDGCGGSCGSCDSDELCGAGGACELCVPSSEGKVCGPDGCGGNCGSCASSARTSSS